MKEPGYSATELLVCSASRLMEDGATAFIGVGIPMLAASLAQQMHAPNLVPVFEFGGTGARLDRLPLAVGESGTFYRAVCATGICDVMETAQRGLIDYGFLGGAQIDPYGNLNTTLIGGRHDEPDIRLPGSGGGNDVASHCWRTISVLRHERRRFVERLDFLTTPGWLDGPEARRAAGMWPDTGPYRVVTDLAILGFHPETRRMTPLRLQPGASADRLRESTGFSLDIPDDLPENEPPTPEELRALRDVVDPERIYI